MSASNALKPVVLIILDGWGLEDPGPGNAIDQARTSAFDELWQQHPHTTLKTSGRDVGLTDGQMGNSEVGHLNIGAGFIVNQAITVIDSALDDGTFFENEKLVSAVSEAKQRNRPLHLLGLVSDGGVHSHINHLKALIHLAVLHNLEDVAIHAILDGRDTSPTGGTEFLTEINAYCAEQGAGRIVSIIGRYFAMDRDQRWERTRKAFDLFVFGKGERGDDPIAALKGHYENDKTDEFMSPITIHAEGEAPVTIQDGDSVIFFNFRSDRPRQLTQALIGPDLESEEFSDRPKDLKFVTMLPYAEFINAPYAFAPITVEHPLARGISDHGLHQFHTAETEKYAHVTYFLNGGREEPFAGEDRDVIPSPDVATYDLQPAMSALAVGQATIEAIQSATYDFIVVNFANCDMVGHTGDIQAAIVATETVDKQLGLIRSAISQRHGAALIIADHGNAERMLVPGTNEPMTAHTTNPVPCILVAPGDTQLHLREGGRLADVAPTILHLLGLKQPETMTGQSLMTESPEGHDVSARSGCGD